MPKGLCDGLRLAQGHLYICMCGSSPLFKGGNEQGGAPKRHIGIVGNKESNEVVESIALKGLDCIIK